MFRRPHHQRIARVLAALDTDLLRRHGCLFGGGTCIALRHGEYRESVDIDFLVSDALGYRELRQLPRRRRGLQPRPDRPGNDRPRTTVTPSGSHQSGSRLRPLHPSRPEHRHRTHPPAPRLAGTLHAGHGHRHPASPALAKDSRFETAVSKPAELQPSKPRYNSAAEMENDEQGVLNTPARSGRCVDHLCSVHT